MEAILTTAGAMSADVITNPIELEHEGGNTCRFTLSCATTGTPAGVFKFQVTDDHRYKNDLLTGLYAGASETAKWITVEIPAGALHPASSSGVTFSGPSSSISYDGTAALLIWVNLENPGIAMRAWWDVTSGGAANTSLRITAATGRNY